MNDPAKWRGWLASILVSAAGLYICLLGAILVMKGATHQVEIHPAIYLGIAAAAVLTSAGYMIAGRAREVIPDVVALLSLALLAEPLVRASSWSHRHGHWTLVVALAVIPYAVLALGGLVKRKWFRNQAPTQHSR